MKYNKTINLKDGRECVLRNGERQDGTAAYEIFNLTHEETDYLLSYPDENSFDAEQEGEFLQQKIDSPNEIEIVAVVDDKIVGMAGIEAVGAKFKVKHRAEFGISIEKAFWGFGIGRAMTEACIECAKKAGYTQLELEVVAENEHALALYESVGFKEFGRNPRGFRSRITGEYQELVSMRLNLEAIDLKKYKHHAEVIQFHESDDQEHWLEEIAKSNWRAGPYLSKLLREGRFHDAVGEHSIVLLLVDGDQLISYCTYAEKDDIQPTDLTPWVGFVYTFPKYRGHRCAGQLFDEVERLARKEGVTEVYLSTNYIGLYEKYGWEFFAMMEDMDGDPSRVYVKKIR